MKAFFITSYGGPEVMRYGDLPDPSTARGEVVVAANMRARPGDYAELETLIREGNVNPVVGEVFPLHEASRAFAALEGGRAPGKIVLGMD